MKLLYIHFSNRKSFVCIFNEFVNHVILYKISFNVRWPICLANRYLAELL